MIVTNRERANWAQKAVDIFREQTGTDESDAIADLVADLCHLAQHCKQDPFEQVRRGLCMFADERDYPHTDGWAPQDQMANVEIILSRGTLCSTNTADRIDGYDRDDLGESPDY